MPFNKSFVAPILAMVFGFAGLVFLLSRFLPSGTSVSRYSDMMGESAPSDAMMGAPSMGRDASGMMKAERSIMPPVPGPDGYGSVAVDVPQENRLIIKTGTLALVVPDVPKAIEDVEAYAVGKKGFVVSSNIEKVNLAFVGNVTIRVPTEIFEESMTALRAFGEVQSQHVTGQDVTEEFVDVQAQIRNLKATEEQFLAIMRQAVKIEDILAVQRELTNVRSQIDYWEGRKKYLTESAAMSSITVYLSIDPRELPIVDESEKWKPLAEIKASLRALLEVGKGLGNLVIRFVVFTPLWALLAFLGWLAYRLGWRLWKRFVG